MQRDKTYQKHQWLMSRMADKLGADLDEAELRGDLTPGQRDAMVLSCTNCTSPEECERLLQANGSIDAAPSFCRNGAAIQDIAKKT